MAIDVESTLNDIGEILTRNGVPKGSFSLRLELPESTQLSTQSLESSLGNVEPLWSCRFVPPLGIECDF